ncbi:myb-related transcription factor, partner of profilin-like [Eriocheir sinensis]|uniref:myb-related transcription factor, partner of profilin-like n=1 Tax=Eriocheir sinensis TaxID=95602 RepID=UPI0021CA132A|nr:myb-related transcription factor, partner of profilin-like [Eriocheir sinensis]
MNLKPALKRRPNFSNEELLVLIREVTDRKTMLLGKLDSTRVTREGKNMAWLAVLEAVNAVGVTRRTEDEVKKKFRDFRSFVKKKVADARQEMLRTGGGPTADTKLSAAEEAMAALISEVAIAGHADVPDSEEVPGGSMFSEVQEDYVIMEHDYFLPQMSPERLLGITAPSSPDPSTFEPTSGTQTDATAPSHPEPSSSRLTLERLTGAAAPSSPGPYTTRPRVDPHGRVDWCPAMRLLLTAGRIILECPSRSMKTSEACFESSKCLFYNNTCPHMASVVPLLRRFITEPEYFPTRESIISQEMFVFHFQGVQRVSEDPFSPESPVVS